MIASAPATLRMVRRRGTLHILHGMKERPWISLILNLQKGGKNSKVRSPCHLKMDQLQIPQAPKCQYQEKLISEHNYSASCTFNCTQEMQRLSTEIQLEKELLALKIESSKRKPISIHDIKYNEEKVSDQQGHFLYIRRKWRLPTHLMYFVGQFSVHCSHQYIQISSPAQTSFTPLNCAGSSKVSSFEMVTVSNTLKSQDSNFIHVHRCCLMA
ncbi:uncharacterized protein LOC134278366 isoform X2 [Saccostrea cucullata]|uniref:uncharacterized protein LOC134243503 isoform X2 n=1 Tax=Saccostrea cuccullata TaxID=36930 RepID=UPI002ED0EE42